MTVHDAEPADIYVDEHGKLWRCIAICNEPTVTFEEVEGRAPTPVGLGLQQAQQNIYAAPQFHIIKDRRSGGVSGLMWQGWKRIFRKSDGQE